MAFPAGHKSTVLVLLLGLGAVCLCAFVTEYNHDGKYATKSHAVVVWFSGWD